MFKCIYYGVCDDDYPTHAMVLTRNFEFATERREVRMIRKDQLQRIGNRMGPESAADRAVEAGYR